MIFRFIQRVRDFFRGIPFGAVRSSKWSQTQKEHLILEPNCRVCGTIGKLLNRLNVHHIIPFWKDPSKENDHKNLITLCRICHFLFGHLKSWFSWNINIKEDARIMLGKITNRP